MTKVRLLFFGYLAERAGTRESWVELPATVQDTRSLLGWLTSQMPEALADPRTRVAINSTVVHGNAPVAPGDEIAFLPVMSGG